MERRPVDDDGTYFKRNSSPEDQQDMSVSRDYSRRRDRDPWEKSVDSFLDSDVRRGDRDRSRDRRRSNSRDRRGRDHRGSPRSDEGGRYSREDREDRRNGDDGRRSRDRSRESRRDWDDRRWNDDRSRDHGSKWPRRDGNDKRDEWLEKVWLHPEGYDSNASFNSGDSDFDKLRYNDWNSSSDLSKEPGQNRTIIIRGLAQHITENDIRQEIAKCRLEPIDIRMIRRKNGTSRGFAFVEFATTEEAITCMEMKRGELMLNNHYRAVMQFSLPKEPKDEWSCDWHCKCSARNFKRRDFCYRCGCTRQKLLEGTEEVSTHPTNTVLLRGLDALTTEASVLETIQNLSSLPIRSVRIGRDPVTNTSFGVCYIEMNCIFEAVYLHNALVTASPIIDGKQVIVSYYKLDSAGNNANSSSSKAGNTAVEAAQWSHQNTQSPQYTLKDVTRLAEYSANLYATNAEEKAAYLAYYQQYYHKQISEGKQIPISLTDLASSTDKTSDENKTKTPLSEPPDGSGDKTYPVPDVSTYQFDKTSGYYYDPYTTLYYDPTSQYYYNRIISKFLYWDSVKNTYLPAPTANTTLTTATTQESSTDAQKDDDVKKKEKEKEKLADKDKVKVAKRIAKDMERWAKTLNQKKEIAKQNLIAAAAATPSLKAQGAADIGFAVLERKDVQPPAGFSIPTKVDSPIAGQSDNSLVAAYGQGSDSEEDAEDSIENEEKQHTDWNKLACLLCKRQFPSKEVLIKHQQLSDLHKQNLRQWYKSRGIEFNEANSGLQYRDRAKERRIKYGEPDKPQPNKLKETYIKAKEATVSYEEPTKMGIGSDNLGNKLLQKMGWQEGMGLGKKNQGRTTIIEPERRSASAGLGVKSQGVVPGPGETYKDCVRKMMYIRYQEIDNT